MKLLSISVLASLFVLANNIAIQAQAASIESVNIPVQYYSIPSEPLDASFKNYTAVVSAPPGELSYTGFTEKALADQYLILEGYNRSMGQGDINISAVIGNMTISGEKLNSRKTKVLETRNGETVEVVSHEFYMEMDYAVPVSYRITDKAGKLIAEASVRDLSDKKSHKTIYYKSDIELEAQWRVSKASKMGELEKELIKDAFEKIYTTINEKYGFKKMTANARFETIGKKKHPAYESFNKNVEMIRAAFSKIKPDGDLVAIRSEVQPALEFFKESVDKYSPSDKEEAKLRHISLYNLASAHFWLEDFDKAIDYARSLIKIDPTDKEAIQLMAEIEKVNAALLKAGKTSRHNVMEVKS